ncbi:MAG: hypothetical protein ACRDTA_24910 [Pseudonocardiaceae bacterium]
MTSRSERVAVLAAVLVWLVLLVYPLAYVANRLPPAVEAAPALVTLAALVVAHVRAAVLIARAGAPRLRPVELAVVAAVAVALPLVFDDAAWFGGTVFLAALIALSWPAGRALLGIAAATALAVATAVFTDLSGDLGNNLIYTARARLLSEGLDDLADLACHAAQVVARSAGASDETLEGFLVEAAEYHRLRLAGVLAGDVAGVLWQRARFDIETFLSGPELLDVADVDLGGEVVRRLMLPAQRARVVSGYLAAFGATAAGAGRLLTKVPFGDLVRDSSLAARAAASPPAALRPGSPS